MSSKKTEILTFFVITLQKSCGAFHQRERVTLQMSFGTEKVNSIIKTKFSDFYLYSRKSL